MSADLIRLVLLCSMVPFVTANVVIYGLCMPWYRSLVGWRVFLTDLGLAALVDISFVYHFLGDNYSARDIVSITVFAIVLAGAVFCTVTLVQALIRRRRDR